MAIYKDKKRGTYYFVTRVNGKQYKRRGFKTKKEAQREEALFDASEEKASEQVYFKELCNEYLDWYGVRRKASSFSKTKGIINTHIIPRFGEIDVQKISTKDVMGFQNDLLKVYSVSHAKKIHQVLTAVFKHAMKSKYISKNPASEAGGVEGETNKHVNYWTLEEFKQFLSVVDDDFYYTLFMTLYYSGARKGELLSLTWNDVDFDTNILDINETVYNGVVTSPKTPSSVRKIKMPDIVMTLLKQLKLSIKPKTGYVVFGEYYDHLSTTTLDRYFHKWIKEAGVKKIRLHDFRHSHASYLINKNTMISLVAQRLGHKDQAITLNTYSHLYPNTEKEIVSEMEDDFKPGKVYDFK